MLPAERDAELSKAWPKAGNNLDLTTLIPLPSPTIEMIISPCALDIQVL